MRRRKTRNVTVDVDICLDEFNEEDLIEHLKEAGYAVIKGDAGKGFDLDDLSNVYEAVRVGRRLDAMSLLERIIWPKWKTPADCQKALELALGKSKAA